MNMISSFGKMLKKEFGGYNAERLGKDVLAGVTVAAVALPLALAFGVSCGADAAAGLVTAIFAGFVIGALSGGSYQISGPTGAMTAVLVTIVAQYGLQGVFIACLMSGVLLLAAGLLKLGGLVSYIPMPVITGFTSGIAVIIALGQVNNLAGLTSSGDTTIQKLVSNFTTPQTLDVAALCIGGAVILFMALYPKKLNRYIPSSLAAIILATAVNMIFGFSVSEVGEIPKTVFLSSRLNIGEITPDILVNLIPAAVSIAALGLIESLLCGASAGRMKNEKLNSNQELIAQGIGNIVLPFFGGVPATAAIARTSVAIKAGGRTRLTSIVHSVVLLLSMFLLGPVMSRIPLASLAGVLIVTAWRMNEWSVIKDMSKKKIKTALSQFFITMAATVVFDLTTAILIGIAFSIVMFMVKISSISIEVAEIDMKRINPSVKYTEKFDKTSVAYITGPLYFGTCGKLEDKLAEISRRDVVVFSMRGVTLADISGVQAIKELCATLAENNTKVYFSCVNPPVMTMLERCGIYEVVDKSDFFWSTDMILEQISCEDMQPVA